MSKPKLREALGPPATGIPILTRIPPEMLENIDQLAQDLRSSRAELIRRMLREWIAEKTEPA